MVFFCCNGCGDTLKKQKVEQHSYSCSGKSVSCIDCNVTFHGAEFKKHTQCVSEAERYQGHLYRATENKGAVKQNSWMERVRGAAEGCRNNAPLKGLLIRIGEYDNVPRKRAKFLNFIRNSMRVNNKDLVERAWDAIEAAGNSGGDEEGAVSAGDDQSNAAVTPEEKENGEGKKRKRKAEKSDAAAVVNGKKKKKKMAVVDEASTGTPEKENAVLPNLNRVTGVQPETPGKAKKYKIVRHIEDIVGKKEEISIKKLKRKVLAAYLEYHPEKSPEDASLLFDRKVCKIPGIAVAHGTVSKQQDSV